MLRYILVFMLVLSSFCGDAIAKSGLPVPRFVTIKSAEANVRTGPNVRYPVRWVYIRKYEPVEILSEFEQWRKIRDRFGEGGWIHESMLSGKRRIVIKADVPQMLYAKADVRSANLALLEPEAQADLISCKPGWCQVKAEDLKGWVQREIIWGIYENEE